MRIAFISPFVYRFKRGIERFTLELAKELTEKDEFLKITILTWQEKRPCRLIDLPERIKIFSVPYFRYYRSKWAVPFYFSNLLKGHYDIVNIFFAGYGVAETLTLLSLFKEQRFNIIFQYPYSLVPHRYREFNRFNLVHRADRIISPSKFIADSVKESFGIESKIIHNGLKSEQFCPNNELRKKMRSKFGFSEEDKILLTIAAFEERKGIQKVIKALPLLNNTVKDVKYVVLGRGLYEPQLKNLIKEMELEKQVFLTGITDNPYPFYCMADIFLLLSYEEAFPLVLPEAMGCGLPVIVSKRRPFDEIVRGDVGRMVNDEDPKAVSVAIADLLLNHDLRMQMGKAARIYAVNNFSWEKIVDEYYRFFRLQINK